MKPGQRLRIVFREKWIGRLRRVLARLRAACLEKLGLRP